VHVRLGTALLAVLWLSPFMGHLLERECPSSFSCLACLELYCLHLHRIHTCAAPTTTPHSHLYRAISHRRYNQDAAYDFLKRHGLAVRAFGGWLPSCSAACSCHSSSCSLPTFLRFVPDPASPEGPATALLVPDQRGPQALS
jgi:hypothetical protein